MSDQLSRRPVQRNRQPPSQLRNNIAADQQQGQQVEEANDAKAGCLETTSQLSIVLAVLTQNYTKDILHCLSTVYKKATAANLTAQLILSANIRVTNK